MRVRSAAAVVIKDEKYIRERILIIIISLIAANRMPFDSQKLKVFLFLGIYVIKLEN